MAVYNTSPTTLSLSQNRRIHSMKCGPSSKLFMFLHKVTSLLPYFLHCLIILRKKKKIPKIAITDLNDNEALPCLVSKGPRSMEICYGVSPSFYFTSGSELLIWKTVPNCSLCNKVFKKEIFSYSGIPENVDWCLDTIKLHVLYLFCAWRLFVSAEVTCRCFLCVQSVS